MAEKTSERKLMPGALIVKTPEMGELIVPSDRGENATANKIVAAIVRKLIIDKVKDWREDGGQMSPKDLKDIAEAAKSLAQFSGEIYKEVDDIPRPIKNVDESKAEDVSFADVVDKK